MARILFHVQHLVGIGHLRRTAALARACAAAGADVMCASGGYPVPDLDIGEARFVQLPPARAQDLRYKALVDGNGRLVDDAWRAARRAALLDTATAFAPDVVVTETFPFGRRLLRFELDALVQWCTTQPRAVRLASSIRDILEGFPGPPGRMDEVIAKLHAHYSLVLVHGDSQWVSLGDTFPAASEIESMLSYTGYISSSPAVAEMQAALPEYDRGLVVVSTGGGAVGSELASIALRAAASGPHDWRWLVLAGHNLPVADFEALRAMAPANARVERNRADFAALLRAARVSISQAGYNTVCDLLGVDTPAVLVPFVADGQLEQTHRARMLARRGRVHTVALAGLGPASLLAAVTRACETAEARRASGETQVPAALDGANVSARQLLALAAC